MTDRETLATVSRSHDDYLGHRGTEKEKGRGTLQTSALPLGYGAGEVITSHGRSRFSTLGSAARRPPRYSPAARTSVSTTAMFGNRAWGTPRSEEHTSELQSRLHLVCRLLLE